ncbi:MAG: FAD-binding protein, partial [Treponema sp.]|nr:FAD-binding protein [Treponema sp.]
CMCPGGFVVPSSSGPDEIVVNGMSAAGRNSQWSNAAFVVETRPEDIPETFFEQAKYNGCKALAGLYYRTWLEKEAKRHGKGQAAPAQRLTDFIAERDSKDFPPTSYTPGIVASRLDQWIPSSISGRLAEAFKTFGANMKGFLCKDATMIAIETRTSTPVRITRNKETNECTELKNLYPAGEGAGYAGGIVSSALDGENTCTAILNKLLNTNN